MSELSKTRLNIHDRQLAIVKLAADDAKKMLEKWSPTYFTNEILAVHKNAILQATNNLFSMVDMINSVSTSWIKDIPTFPSFVPSVFPTEHEPMVLPVIHKIKDYAVTSKPTMLGVKLLHGGSFQYKRRMLKGLSRKNAEGRLLALFVESEDRFVTDEEIRTKMRIPDNRSFSWVLRNLKKALKENNITCVIERRWNPDGYTFVSLRSTVSEAKISPNTVN